MSKIKLKVTRPMMLRAERCETGDILTVEATAVPSLLESGRCELLDPADAAAVIAASREAVAELMRLQRRMAAPPGSPWQTVNR